MVAPATGYQDYITSSFMAIYKVGDMCQLPTYSQANEVQMVITYSAAMAPMLP